ncbi:formate dehydrogenase accessory sulfurtransferase FdhD [Nocardioides mesophilus]|uniref:Sulfur carrier protein FdhD n=1 Tax=Nocardioides mesophilus TaxID=433659 RepID=A0A7G9RAT0_9ACTN|nr:formate dehydrogenase accessory sulfurtransferase FdhD [Nocardioides mesophilus]QNN52705.1 formate dehydrogenase accessory sulfurtransferase FdhD [Nocardioides mesophilus]
MALSRRPGPSTRTRVHEHVDGRVLQHEDRLATEEPLEIRCSWPGRPAYRVAVTMRTPGHDFELAAGFLLAEGTVTGQGHLHTVAYCTDQDLLPEQEHNVVTVTLRSAPRSVPAERYAGLSAASSACGVCGTQSIDDVLGLADVRPARETAPVVVPAGVLHALPARLREAQRVFATTGGLHAAGLFTADGEPLVVREDIGRHNAVDKVVGARLLAGAPTGVPVLAVSGRIGFEIVQKAVAAGVGVLAAVGAPSSLAVDLAQRAGLCTVGFLRPDRFVTYSAPERIGV